MDLHRFDPATQADGATKHRLEAGIDVTPMDGRRIRQGAFLSKSSAPASDTEDVLAAPRPSSSQHGDSKSSETAFKHGFYVYSSEKKSRKLSPRLLPRPRDSIYRMKQALIKVRDFFLVEMAYSVTAIFGVILGIILAERLKSIFPSTGSTYIDQNASSSSNHSNSKGASSFNSGWESMTSEGQLNGSSLPEPVKEWVAATALFVMPGTLAVGFFEFASEAVFVSFIIKGIVTRPTRESSQLLFAALVVSIIVTAAFSIVIYVLFKIFEQDLAEQSLLEVVRGLNSPEYLERAPGLPEKNFFMVWFVLAYLCRKMVDWNMLRLISAEMTPLLQYEDRAVYENPLAEVAWISPGPGVVLEMSSLPSKFGLLMLGLLLGFAVRTGGKQLKLLRRFFKEVSDVWLVIACYTRLLFALGSPFVFAWRIMQLVTPVNDPGWQTNPIFLIPVLGVSGVTAAIIAISGVYLVMSKSPVRTFNFYFRLMTGSLLSYYPGTGFILAIGMFTTYHRNRKLQRCALLYCAWLAFAQPVNVACALFLTLTYCKGMRIPMTFWGLLKIYFAGVAAAGPGSSAVQKFYDMRSALGLINEDCLCTKRRAELADIAIAFCARLDMISLALEVLVAWAFSQVIVQVWDDRNGH